MSQARRGHGQIRRGQIITTYGPGALIDLPRHSAIVGGLDSWTNPTLLEEIVEPRLIRKLEIMKGIGGLRLFAPPAADDSPGGKLTGIAVWLFPEWFLVQESDTTAERERSRRLVHLKSLDERRRFDGRPVVATRFVRACPRGHVDDILWYRFVHGSEDPCRRQLWLDERGTSGDLVDLHVRCECGKSRGLYEASSLELNPLESCNGSEPWLGRHAGESCGQPSRLLIRTASNAYFPQVVSVLSLPDRGVEIEAAVREVWDFLQAVDSLETLGVMKRVPQVMTKLAPFSDRDVLEIILKVKSSAPVGERPVKQVELDALLAVPEGFGDDVPVDENFHARRLPERIWRRSDRSSGIRSMIQVHRLREILALVGFTRFEAMTPDIHGEFDSDVTGAELVKDPKWFPAVENRGEGIFIELDPHAVSSWLAKPAVKERITCLENGHNLWCEEREITRPFPGGPYVLLHTLSHLLLQSLAMCCGYPASSIRERIYVDPEAGRFGILLYTASSDAEGTLGGLVQEARHMEDHLFAALRQGALCSNDPICAHHEPRSGMEKRRIHGSACHGCALVAETSCEMRNDYLDRALVVPVMGSVDTAFFESRP